MNEKVLESDLKCIPIQKMVFEKTYGVTTVNAFEPRNVSGEHVRDDGVVYVNDICYTRDYPNSYVDIYYSNADKAQKRPTVIYLHGGGMIFGDKASGDPLAVGITGSDSDFYADIAKRGYNVIAPNYALAPEYRFPTQLKQLDQLLEYLTKHEAQHGIDMEHVFLGGASAGACLSEIYGTMLVNREYANKIGISPSFCKEQIIGLLIDEAVLSVRHYDENMNALMGCWMGVDHPSEQEEISYLLDATQWIKNSYFPSFIISCNAEITFQDSAEDLKALLEKNGTTYEYYFRTQECDVLEHGFMKRYATNACAKECFEQMLAFMERLVNGTAV